MCAFAAARFFFFYTSDKKSNYECYFLKQGIKPRAAQHVAVISWLLECHFCSAMFSPLLFLHPNSLISKENYVFVKMHWSSLPSRSELTFNDVLNQPRTITSCFPVCHETEKKNTSQILKKDWSLEVENK